MGGEPWMSSVTLVSIGTFVRGDKTLLCPSSISQFEPLIGILVLSPTLQLKPDLMRSFAFKILRQANDPLALAEAYRILPSGKNFALKTLYNNEFLQCISLQNCFARRAILNFWRSLKPSPPFPFELHNFSYLSQWILRLSLFWPHQNLLIIFQSLCIMSLAI